MTFRESWRVEAHEESKDYEIPEGMEDREGSQTDLQLRSGTSTIQQYVEKDSLSFWAIPAASLQSTQCWQNNFPTRAQCNLQFQIYADIQSIGLVDVAKGVNSLCPFGTGYACGRWKVSDEPVNIVQLCQADLQLAMR